MKVNFYVKPLKTIASNTFETNAWELVVAFISAVFAYVSYKGSFGLVFFPMLAVSILCIVSVLVTLFYSIIEIINDVPDEK
ncbi:hypothetical protein ACPUVO_14835 [Pseudocolwellia sp. HL-MZ19]|uniref:hypothetical protein n=1 Tax=Pseudocolwellia sp. HL-MZ19 TaxID=3400846 RepID=UPI003CF5FEF8